MKTKKRDAGKANLGPLVGAFVILKTQKNSVSPVDLTNAEVQGMYKTQKEAEEYIRKNAADSYDGMGEAMHAGEDSEWGCDLAICEIKRVCRPVPIVFIRATIMDIPNAAVPVAKHTDDGVVGKGNHNG
jgi:hypothetical protein